MQNRTVSDLGERALIERIMARLAMPSWVVVGPGDDAAVIEPERGTLEVLTTDAQVEGIHFDRRFVPPDAIGHRALAVNLSDLAAMGARPRAALLSLALPDPALVADVDGMIDGLLALASRSGVTLVGGNITRSPAAVALHVTAIGSVRARRILRRAGARPGDEVYVTGTLGDAATGLQHLQELCGADPVEINTSVVEVVPSTATMVAMEADPRGMISVALETDCRVLLPEAGASGPADVFVPRTCIDRYLRPEPRVRIGLLLGRNRAASACVDLSDGLADGVRQLAAASDVGITVHAGALPISEDARRWHAAHASDPVVAAFTGGDDFELLFTVRPTHRGRLRAVRRHLGAVSVTRIGIVTKAREVLLRNDDGTFGELPSGFEHFRPPA